MKRYKWVVLHFQLVFTLSLECLIFVIMWGFFCKKKTIGQKYEKCFQLSKANVDLNRSRFSWLTAADN